MIRMKYLLLLLPITSVCCFGQIANNSLVGKWIARYDTDSTRGTLPHTGVYRSAILLVFNKDHGGSLSETDKKGNVTYLYTFDYTISNQNRITWIYRHTRYNKKEVSEFTLKDGILRLNPFPVKEREAIPTFYLGTYKKEKD